jgi:glycosyltransferase involved in cell wall biosynthesis
VSPNQNSIVETFINAQLERLPGRVEVLFGYPSHARDEAGTSFIPTWARALKFGVRKVLGPGLLACIDDFYFGRYLQRRRIAVVLAEYGPTGAYVFELCRRHSVPLVTQFFGYDAYDEPTLTSHRAAYARLLAEEAATIAVSRPMTDRLYALGARPGSVRWIPCGADPDRFAGERTEPERPTFLAAGRFVEKKAPNLTLLAFSRVLEEIPDARLQMVGAGPLLEECRRLAVDLGIDDCVEFLGFRPHAELADLMLRATAFVQHSVTAPSGDSEGTPVAILEASAAGLPIVATRHGGIPDVVVDGITGYLVDEGDVGAMADRMRQLAEDPGLATRLGEQARMHVSRNFSQAVTLGQVSQVLQSVMLGRT